MAHPSQDFPEARFAVEGFRRHIVTGVRQRFNQRKEEDIES
jgi:hypothetical protein